MKYHYVVFSGTHIVCNPTTLEKAFGRAKSFAQFFPTDPEPRVRMVLLRSEVSQ